MTKFSKNPYGHWTIRGLGFLLIKIGIVIKMLVSIATFSTTFKRIMCREHKPIEKEEAK